MQIKPKLINVKSLPVKKIRIAGIDYPVTLVDDLGNEAGHSECDHTHINVCTQNSDDHARCVLMHECMEVINHRYDGKLSHHQIYTMEAAIIQLLRDNPDFVKFICA